MKTWEYSEVYSSTLMSQMTLQSFGRLGWEMCGVVSGKCDFVYYFKREIPTA